MRYLLDSTLLIDHANGDPGAIRLLGQLVGEGHDLYTCDVVACEVLSRGQTEDLRHLETLLGALEYVATTPAAARRAGSSRRARNLAGGKRALGDALIAGIAAELNATVVTRNRDDFVRQGIEVLDY